MLFQGRDGELRIYEHGTSGATYYLKLLFCDMNMTCPIGRPQREEMLVFNRTRYDSNAHMITGGDEMAYGPIPTSFSCRIADTDANQNIFWWLGSGATSLAKRHVRVAAGSTVTIQSRKGKSAGIHGNTLPDFVGSGTSKFAFLVQVRWDGSTDFGISMDEVWFPPQDQSITEAEDSLTLNMTGHIFGGVSRITGFTGGTNNFGVTVCA